MSRLDNCLTAIVGDKLPIETARKTFFFLLGIAVMLIVIALPSPSPFYKGEEAIPLTANAKIVMAVLCFAVIQWMTEAIPFPATSLCLIVFLHILGVASFDKLVTLGFGNNVLLFLMGAMGLSAAMTSSGLARRFMLWMLTKVGRRTDRIVLAFIAIGTMTSMWVTDMAVAAMLLPLGVSILESSGCKPLQSNFGRALMIGIVWGALIGGTATPAGCGRRLAWGMLSGVGELHPVLRVLAVIGMVELLKILFSSNSVTGAVVMPLIIALAMDIGMNPWILAGPAGIATSMAFIMVTSSPTNVIPYSSGYFRISEFAKSGVVMTIIGILAVTASVAIFGRFANMNIW